MRSLKYFFFLLCGFFLASCYQTNPERGYGGLEIYVDREGRNIVHVIYRCDATRKRHILAHGSGGWVNLHYRYYVVHHQLGADGKVKTKIYPWFREFMKDYNLPDEHALVSCLFDKKGKLGDFIAASDLGRYHRYDHSKMAFGSRYYYEAADSLYYNFGDTLEANGILSISEIGQTALFQSPGWIIPAGDTIYAYNIDTLSQPPKKCLVPKGLGFQDLLTQDNKTYISLVKKEEDSVFIYSFNPQTCRIGDLERVLDVSEVPEKVRNRSGTLRMMGRKLLPGVEYAERDYSVSYSSTVLKDIYFVDERVEHYTLNEEILVFPRIRDMK